MPTDKMSEVIRHLRKIVLQRGGAGLTDAQLMEEYLGRHEEAALGALVRRHGPMVWGVCCRILRNNHDAEDAFQTTFLVLVRKAASIVPKEMVGNWLYGVAHQTALNARATAARRKKRERQMSDMPQPEARHDDLWHDLQPLLDQELSRLPNKYRAAIVLCDLEGKTRKEAARQLGVPEGTIAGQLARARTMLAKRLARHGLGASGVALASALSQSAASACVSPLVVSSTIKAVSLVAAGKMVTGLISANVAALTEGVVKTMLLTKLKTMVTVLVVVTVLGSGVGTLGHMALAENQEETKQDGVKSSDGTGENAPKEQEAKGQGVEPTGLEKPFENAPGHSWFRRPVKWDDPWTLGSISGHHFNGGSLTITQMPDGSLVFILVGAEPSVKSDTNYRIVAFDRERKRYLAPGWGGGSSPNASLSLFTKYYLLDAKELPAAKVAYLGIEAEIIMAKDFEDFAEWKFAGGGVQATGIRDKGGFSVVPMESPKGRTKLCLSFALNEERARSSDFRVMGVDADGKRHEAQGKSTVAAGGKGTTVITMVLEFNLSSDSIRTLVVQRARGK